jgi:predicted AAA+ superfamily ATPase
VVVNDVRVDAVVLDRPRSLSRVAPWVGKPLIKVLTGQRRIGESCLLQTLARTLAATEPRLDLCVTGSNAELLSGEMATRFAGRSITIEVHPLSYDEFLVFHARADDDASLAAYLRDGGLPFLRNVSLTDVVVFEYLSRRGEHCTSGRRRCAPSDPQPRSVESPRAAFWPTTWVHRPLPRASCGA